jgi:hypothetical protein
MTMARTFSERAETAIMQRFYDTPYKDRRLPCNLKNYESAMTILREAKERREEQTQQLTDALIERNTREAYRQAALEIRRELGLTESDVDAAINQLKRHILASKVGA